MLNVLYEYTKNWKLSVNVSKTKIVVFRNGGKTKDHEKWCYNDSEVEIVNQFTYLGVILNYNGKFYVTQTHR